MPSITVTVKQRVEVKYLRARMEPRYWEDAKVNGEEDKDGTLIPLRKRDMWEITVDLNTGTILEWPVGTTADVHYKVCDAGYYELLDDHQEVVKGYDGYVPKILCPGGQGYGDYVIMRINGWGQIEGFSINLESFEDED